MKKLYLAFFVLFCSFASLRAQTTCASSNNYCAGETSLSFESPVNGPDAEPGINYDCMLTQPNPHWFTIMTAQSGNLDFQISQVNPLGAVTDVDYILWGPFDFNTCGAANLNPATEISCSYAAAGVENFTIANAPAGKYYKLLITNFSEDEGTITIAQTNAGQPNSGGTTCNIVCPLTTSGDGSYACPETVLMAIPEYPGASYVWTSSVSGTLPETSSNYLATQPGVYTVSMILPGCLPTSATAVVYGSTIELPEVEDLSICSTNTLETFDLSVNETAVISVLGTVDYEFYGFFHSESDARDASNPIADTTNYSGTNNEIIYFSVENYSSGCIAVGNFTLHLDAIIPVIAVEANDQTVTIYTDPPGDYQYAVDGENWTSSNIFTNVELGQHTLLLSTSCGVVQVAFAIITPNPPFGTSPQYYVEGQTLGDLEMTGQNIQWYSDTNKTVASIPLPLSTPLVNNTIYYATQTVNGAESTNRFPVLVLSTLANPEYVFSGLNYFPNPAKNILTVSNAMPIDNIAIYSILGQSVFTSKINSMQTDIDISNLSAGTYFVKLQSGGAQKTVRFIKE